MKLSTAIEGYLLDKKLEFSPKTLSNYALFFRYFVEFTDDPEIETITTKMMRRFLVSLMEDRQYSKRSVHDVWTALSSLYTWATIELDIEHMIRGKIKQPVYPDKAIEPFTQTEIKQLLEATKFSTPWRDRNGKLTRSKRPTAKRDTAIILVLLDSGVRNTELRQFCLKDYDTQNGRLFIAKGKGGNRRFVVLGNRARKALWRYLTTRPNAKPDEPLFATSSGKPVDKSNLRHLLENIAELAGLSRVFPHHFRHTFAINFLRNGGNVLTLKELLGHRTLKTVTIYARIAEVDIDAAVKYSVADHWDI